MKKIANAALFVFLGMLAACSGEGGDDGEHVWKEQTDTMDRARQAEEMMQKKAQEQQKAIDKTGQ